MHGWRERGLIESAVKCVTADRRQPHVTTEQEHVLSSNDLHAGGAVYVQPIKLYLLAIRRRASSAVHLMRLP